MRKPSLITCRKVDEVLKASMFMLYQPMVSTFNSRKRVDKIRKHVA